MSVYTAEGWLNCYITNSMLIDEYKYHFLLLYLKLSKQPYWLISLPFWYWMAVFMEEELLMAALGRTWSLAEREKPIWLWYNLRDLESYLSAGR